MALDAFIDVRGNPYSVPGHLCGETVAVRITLDGVLKVFDAEGVRMAECRLRPKAAGWQRCQVHFGRNVLSHTPSRHKADMAEGLKRVFRAESAAEAREKAHALMEEMEQKAPRAVTCLEEGLEDALAVLALP